MISLYVNEKELKFEHSLVSLSDWEAEHERPFFPPALSNDQKTVKEMLRYFELMLINKKHEHLVQLLTEDQYTLLADYMQRDRTATTVRNIQSNNGRTENVTSELIYYWLVAFKIQFQPTDTWHLNRLLTLVRVCSAKQAQPNKKSTKAERIQQAQSMRELNEQRLAARGTKG